jgi:hypothetical protein
VAIVAPLEIHKRLEEVKLLGNYQLLLAHEVLSDPAAYRNFWQPRRDQFIIMDNSVIELKKPLPMSAVLEAAEVVNAHMIVLPDVIGNRIKTYELFAEAMAELDRLGHPPFGVMGVAQGKTLIDVFSCGRDMARARVDMLSVPRHLAKRLGSRQKITQMFGGYNVPIHLLGFSDYNFDDMMTLGYPHVMGIDSALPIWYGLQGHILPRVPAKYSNLGKRPADYPKAVRLTEEAIINVRRVREWANIVPTAPTATPQAQ